jgi:AcrR family transcriptional regulator
MARLPAHARRQVIVDAALEVFAHGSYAGATTAEIARAAGVSEPILYRHFGSKRDLYLACIEEAWRRLREAFEEQAARLGPRDATFAIGQTALGLRRERTLVPNLWVQALTEAPEDAEIRRFLRRHLREVHDYVAGLVRRGQEAGGVLPDRDPDAEAWIFIAGGLLLSVGDRLGGLLGHDDFARIARARHRWLTGREAPENTPEKENVPGCGSGDVH